MLNAKPGITDDILDLSIEMTAARKTLPWRRKVVLPPLDAGFGRAAVLDEEQATCGLQHPAHFAKRDVHPRDTEVQVSKPSRSAP